MELLQKFDTAFFETQCVRESYPLLVVKIWIIIHNNMEMVWDRMLIVNGHLIGTEIGDVEQRNDHCIIFAVAELFVQCASIIICLLELIDLQSCQKV